LAQQLQPVVLGSDKWNNQIGSASLAEFFLVMVAM